jgi:type IV pilus modification protein PilV
MTMMKPSTKCLTDQKNEMGFTLIEILFAMVIFAIGFLAIASMQISAGKSNRTASERTFAANIASDHMERLMSLSFDDSNLDPTANPHLDNQDKYNIEWTVTDTDINSDGNNDAKIITLTVSWDDIFSGGADQLNVTLDFIKPDVL